MPQQVRGVISQAKGKPVDKRADIWSFGAVLWEMLSGRRLFDGETVSHTLADVLRSGIDLGELPSGTTRALRELIGRCLDRDLKQRLRDIGDAWELLEEPSPAQTLAPSGSPRARPSIGSLT